MLLQRAWMTRLKTCEKRLRPRFDCALASAASLRKLSFQILSDPKIQAEVAAREQERLEREVARKEKVEREEAKRREEKRKQEEELTRLEEEVRRER